MTDTAAETIHGRNASTTYKQQHASAASSAAVADKTQTKWVSATIGGWRSVYWFGLCASAMG